MQESGIYDRHNITQEALAGLDGTGTYVSVERARNEIIIRQDFNGCYGLFVYRDGGRFVMSNSFLYLMEYMSRRTRLTLNRDYANHFLIMGLSSMAYSETFINEIELLPRDVVVRIDISSRTLSTERINYGENTVRLNSAEGMKILDEWFAKWTGIIRNLYERTPNIMADLSGGFDSRMAFTLLVNSGIDLNKICINSIKAKGYTFNEDYGIASEIGRHFGFSLNNTENFTGGELNYSLDDSVRIAFCSLMFVHNQLQVNGKSKFEDKRYHLMGYWGENVRAYWHPGEDSFMFYLTSGARNFSMRLRKELADSTERIITRLLEEISRKNNIPIGNGLVPHVFRETWGRSHFGSISATKVALNKYNICPLGDVGLARLRLDDENCADKNLLMAVIFTRYCPELLKFRFTKNETIRSGTLKFAERICTEFPRAESTTVTRSFSIAVRDPEVSVLLAGNNPPVKDSRLTEYSMEVFKSTTLRKLFATCFDEELYINAEEYCRWKTHYPFAKCHTVIATTEVIKHIIISEGTQEYNIANDFREFADSKLESASDKRTEKLSRMSLLFRIISTFPGRAWRRIIKKICRK